MYAMSSRNTSSKLYTVRLKKASCSSAVDALIGRRLMASPPGLSVPDALNLMRHHTSKRQVLIVAEDPDLASLDDVVKVFQALMCCQQFLVRHQ
eukprot:14597828-Ditylum_brightwellii.AAC.1